MNYFQFFSHDQEQFNWLIFDAHREPPYLTVKPRYSQHVCPKCIKIDHDRVFEEGFEEGLRIRAKGDFFGSDEGFECVSDNVLRVVEQGGFAGLAFKPIPGTKLHVMNLRRQVDADKNAYKYSKGVCEVCKRPKEITGLIKFLSQIKVPDEPRTFFGPTFDRGGSMNGDRDLFATEDIVLRLKEQRIKGGTFQRLLTTEEESLFKEAAANQVPFKWPRGSRVIL